MSLGATASAPAAACEMAVFASSSSVTSLSTVPSSRTMPQWPCEVYSHMHTSVITTRSGWASLIARTASCTTPSLSYAPEPCASFSAGMPNSSTAGMPSAWALAGLLDRVGDREAVDPRHRLDRRAAVGAELDEHRVDEVGGRQLGLAHHVAQGAGAAEAAHAGGGEGHPLSVGWAFAWSSRIADMLQWPVAMRSGPRSTAATWSQPGRRDLRGPRDFPVMVNGAIPLGGDPSALLASARDFFAARGRGSASSRAPPPRTRRPRSRHAARAGALPRDAPQRAVRAARGGGLRRCGG